MTTPGARWRHARALAWLSLAFVCPAASPAGSGPVALQSADPACPDDSGAIYVDCGNGTVTDTRTGLVWLQDADCLEGQVTFDEAVAFVAGLADMPDESAAALDDCGLSDGSSPGEWRLPSAAEWEAMMADPVAQGCTDPMEGTPAITNDAGTDCWQEGPGSSITDIPPFAGYWSATVAPSGEVWVGGVAGGAITKDFPNFQLVWPTRGGQ